MHLQADKEEKRSQNRNIDHDAPTGAQAVGPVQDGRARGRRWEKAAVSNQEYWRTDPEG